MFAALACSSWGSRTMCLEKGGLGLFPLEGTLGACLAALAAPWAVPH